MVTPGAVFCDRTAAWLHGVDVFDYRELEILRRWSAWCFAGRVDGSSATSATAVSGTSRRTTSMELDGAHA